MALLRAPWIVVDKDATPPIQHMATDVNAAIAALARSVTQLAAITDNTAHTWTPTLSHIFLKKRAAGGMTPPTGERTSPGPGVLPRRPA